MQQDAKQPWMGVIHSGAQQIDNTIWYISGTYRRTQHTVQTAAGKRREWKKKCTLCKSPPNLPRSSDLPTTWNCGTKWQHSLAAKTSTSRIYKSINHHVLCLGKSLRKTGNMYENYWCRFCSDQWSTCLTYKFPCQAPWEFMPFTASFM